MNQKLLTCYRRFCPEGATVCLLVTLEPVKKHGLGNAANLALVTPSSDGLKNRQVTLHLGTGGWDKVIQGLQEVGVLGPDKGDKSKLAVAQLYRGGLGIIGVGI